MDVDKLILTTEAFCEEGQVLIEDGCGCGEHDALPFRFYTVHAHLGRTQLGLELIWKPPFSHTLCEHELTYLCTKQNVHVHNMHRDYVGFLQLSDLYIV